MIKHKDILVWPNFISKLWGKYYLYSELPHNSPNWQAKPLIMNTDDKYFRILTDQSGNPQYLALDGKIVNEEIATLKICYNTSVADIPYKYEIYESKKPFRGLNFTFQGINGGYAVIKYGVDANAPLKNKMDDIINLKEAALGVDFGSTNSSVAYYSLTKDRLIESLRFKNRRVSLLKSDDKNNYEVPAVEDEDIFLSTMKY